MNSNIESPFRLYAANRLNSKFLIDVEFQLSPFPKKQDGNGDNEIRSIQERCFLNWLHVNLKKDCTALHGFDGSQEFVIQSLFSKDIFDLTQDCFVTCRSFFIVGIQHFS